jgi:hypothetical protein
MFTIKRIGWLVLASFWLILIPLKAQAVLSAEGWGSTPNAARENALQELSQVVSAAVNSDVTIRNELRDNQVTTDVASSLNVKSASYFQGVEYGMAMPEAQGYRIEAMLSRQAAQQTVSHLSQAISLDLMTLNRTQIQDVIDRAVFLSALLNLMPNDFANKAQSAQQANDTRALAFKHLNFARLTIHVKPEQASINLGQFKLASGQTELIAPGNYRLVVNAQGYQSINQPLSLSAGENRQLNLALVPRTGGQLQLDVQGEHADTIRAQSRQTLAGLGIAVQANVNNQISLKLDKQRVTEISGITFYNLRLSAEVTQGAQPILVRTASLNNIAESQVDARVKAMSHALINAVLSSDEIKVIW